MHKFVNKNVSFGLLSERIPLQLVFWFLIVYINYIL